MSEENIEIKEVKKDNEKEKRTQLTESLKKNFDSLYIICNNLCKEGKMDFETAPVINFLHTTKLPMFYRSIEKGKLKLPIPKEKFAEVLTDVNIEKITIVETLKLYIATIRAGHQKGSYGINDVCKIKSIEATIIALLTKK